MKLAINGGKKLRSEPFPAYNTIGKEEEEAVLRVLKSGKLSTYLGTWHDDFYGGSEVQELEKEWAAKFKVKHAISVNSATSGLYAAVGAVGIEPGDEIIVSPYTMSASATAALVYGAIPVFADIEEDFYCLSYEAVKKKINPKTKAIIVVDIFGLPYDKRIDDLAKEYNLKIIEDTAQAPGAIRNGKFAGTLGDIGIYSLNYHKHIHSGEGGMVVTDNDELAQKIKMIRNHAEAVISAKGYKSKSELVNMVGFNYRMTEIEAAIAREQLKKLDVLLAQRIDNVTFLNKELEKIPAIKKTKTRQGCTHSYYVHPLQFNKNIAGVHRNIFIDAVKAELPRTLLRDDSDVLLSYGYTKPLYMQPLYQEKIAFGSSGYPFNLSNIEYKKGDCPICEEMYEDKLILHELMRPGMSKSDLQDVLDAFNKVWENKEELL
ncbi:MAG: DegT/DnrJ/EryC1/StrS family aminotransferase [Campylobacterota bacterium]|nr:DegT/DnrJ/EryC1/StrS family aminotransferase [Campylobacterota bacterium]